jgi:AcrR family transcriptional regulator
MAATATSKGQIFHYFPAGRADLLRAVAQHEAEQVIAAQEPYLSDLSTLASWESWHGAVMAHYIELGDRCPLGTLTTELGKTSPEAREIVARLYDTWEAALARGVMKLQHAGALGAQLDGEATARSILAAIQGGVTMLRATHRVAYLQVALDAAMACLRPQAQVLA